MRIRPLAPLFLFGLTAAALPPGMDNSLTPYADRVLPAESATPSAPGELRIRFMGASTLLLTDGRKSILFDGFFSRPAPRDLFRLESNLPRIHKALDRAGITTLDMVIAVHSHYDHAMDSAYIAWQKEAPIMGSASTAWIARSAKLPEDQICVVDGGDTVSVGAFKLTAIKTLHGPPNLFPGRIRKPLEARPSIFDYKSRDTLSFLVEHQGLKILIHSTAGFRPNDMAGVEADVVLLGIGGLRPLLGYGSYWRELVIRTGARLVIPIHWDDFFRPLDQPLAPALGFDVSMEWLKERAANDGRKLALLPPFAPVDIRAEARRAPAIKPVSEALAGRGHRSPLPARSAVRCPPGPERRRTS